MAVSIANKVFIFSLSCFVFKEYHSAGAKMRLRRK